MTATTIAQKPELKVTLDGETYQVDFKITTIAHEDRRLTGRAYVWISEALRTKLGKHPDYTTRGTDAANDKAWDTYNRAEIRQMTATLQAAWKAYVDSIGVDDETLKAKFSRVAGCSCGCSPGFRLPDYGYDIYVTVK